MEWKDVSIDVPGLDILLQTGNLGSAGLEAYVALMSASKSVLKVMSMVRAFTDAKSAALQASLRAAQKLIPDVLQDPEVHASTHLLHIPVTNPYDALDGPPVIPGGDLSDIMLSAILQGPDSSNPGGNYRVYKKIIESIFDPGDEERPYFYGDTAMGAVVVAYGADSYPLAMRLSMDLLGLMGGAGGMGLPGSPPVINIPADEWQTPVPQNVKVRASSWRATGEKTGERARDVVSYGDSKQANAIHVKWDNPGVIKRFKMNTPLVFRLTSWHVYVKAGEPIKFGDTIKDYEVLSAVIPVVSLKKEGVRLRGVSNGAVITHLSPDTTYYVSVSYGVEMVDESLADGAVQIGPRIDTLSEQIRVRVAEQHGYSTYVPGTPPDWVALKSPVYAVPELRMAYEQMTGFLQILSRNATAYTGELDALLDAGDSAAQWYADTFKHFAEIAKAIQGIIEKIEDATVSLKASGRGGIWATSFSGPGSKGFFMHQIRQALLDSATKNAPPYLNKRGSLGALVFLVEGKSPAEVELLLGPLKAIFGSSAAAETPIQGLSDDVLADARPGSSAGWPGAVPPAGSMEEAEAALTPSGLGVGSGDAPDTSAPGSLAGADVDDDPC